MRVRSTRGTQRLLGVGLVLGLLAAACAGPAGRDAGTGGGGVSTSGFARLVGPADPAERVDFALVLRMARERALDRSLTSVNDPSSPSFGHFVTPAEYGRRSREYQLLLVDGLHDR